jgi:hypothetical protein
MQTRSSGTDLPQQEERLLTLGFRSYCIYVRLADIFAVETGIGNEEMTLIAPLVYGLMTGQPMRQPDCLIDTLLYTRALGSKRFPWRGALILAIA